MTHTHITGSVAEFMRRGGQTVPLSPQVPPAEDIDLHLALIREEFNELIEAYADTDYAGVVDAFADLAVVAVSGLIRHVGEECANHVMNAVLDANMAKVFPEATRDSAGKIQKPEDWTPADIEREIGFASLEELAP